MEKWRGKTALITGAYVGIGGAISEELVKYGMNVVGCGRNLERLEEFAHSLKGPGHFIPVRCDISKEEEVLNMFKIAEDKYGGIHVWINNAGLNFDTTLLEGKTEDWRKVLDINVIGLSMVTREAVKSMKENGINNGHIINIGSLGGLRLEKDYHAAHMYYASKFAVRALTEGTRNEVRAAGTNIRVSQISPGVVETEFQYRMRGPEKAKKMYGSIQTMEPKDIADSVVYVLSAPLHVQVTQLTIETTDSNINFAAR